VLARVSKTRAGLSAGIWRVPSVLAPAEIQRSTSTITSLDANTDVSLIVPVADTSGGGVEVTALTPLPRGNHILVRTSVGSGQRQ
jgi:hypothetical protein